MSEYQTEVQRLRAALEKARQYVMNGYELGYIDDREGYTEALVREIDEALSTTTEPTHAAKVEPVREPVAWFAQQMEAKLRENDHRGGWANCRTEYLVDRLYEEYHELLDAVEGGSPAEEITREAADVANFAMMIADNARRMVEGVGNDA